jgi:DNA-binding MarR family transcriptional regulator
MDTYQRIVRFLDRISETMPGAPEQQIRVIIAIMNEPGITQTDLGEQLNMTQASVSRNCRALSIFLDKDKHNNPIRRGHDLIEMRPDLYNGKRLACWLTPKGQQLGADLHKHYTAHL